MTCCQVVLDIPTRALADVYDYAVPEALAATVEVGCAVRVRFSGRGCVGYVVGLSDAPASKIAAGRLRPVEEVLAPSCFDATMAALALWMAREYACPAIQCVRLLLPPGRTLRARKGASGAWEIQSSDVGRASHRWVALAEGAEGFEPRANATRQRDLLAALAGGPVALSELSALMPGITPTVRRLHELGVVDVIEGTPPRPKRPEPVLSSAVADEPERLTRGQEGALMAIARAQAARDGSVVVVDGVTGSGKTEVYLEVIEGVLERGGQAIVLVPEISLTPQTVGRFRHRLGDTVAVLHSRLTTAERRGEWERLFRGEARVAIGARSALFAPLPELALVVIDEEHEFSYKQEQAPRYHAREVAAELARLKRAALVLGSATPSLESLARCEAHRWRGVPWRCVEMAERAGGGTLPEVSVVDMRGIHTDGATSILAPELERALVETHERGEKAVLLLNRRGFATFLLCEDCGCVPECPHCSCSLTYHARTRQLMCHSCGRTWPIAVRPDVAARCPHCGSRHLALMGLGTERVEAELALLLPEAEVVRMDADTTRAAGGHERLLERFDATPGAILVGTQMIAKGLDFPEVTLVGVVNADTSLKLPDFRAAERTFDLLEQVAGRAGRGQVPGRVFIQTYWATHPAILGAAAHDARGFVAAELAARREAGYPPYVRLANVTLTGTDERRVAAQAAELAERLRAREREQGWQVVGPAPCLRSKVKDRYRHHVSLKAPATAELGSYLRAATADIGGPEVSVSIDVDPYDLF